MNKITFRLKNDITESDYYMLLIYIENNEILMTLRNLYQNKVIEKLRAYEIIAELQNEEYEIAFEFSTEQAKKKSTLFKQSFHITIQLVPIKFFKEKYLAYQGAALSNCESSRNLPLSLSR